MVRKKSKPAGAKQGIVHTKRRQVEYEDGWTLIVDTPKAKKVPLPAFHGGDFEIGGVSYIERTLEEMKAEFEHWKKAWEDSEAHTLLKQKLEPIDKINNAVILGLGSLQSSRREGRRASATQLAALQTIIENLRGGEIEVDVVLQDPQYTKLDKEFLTGLGYKIADDPAAFEVIGEKSLVFAIHCYGEVYMRIGEGVRPAVLVGTDVENFGRFDTSNYGIKESLEDMVKDYEVLDFPQVRHDFSDTKIHLRKP